MRICLYQELADAMCRQPRRRWVAARAWSVQCPTRWRAKAVPD